MTKKIFFIAILLCASHSFALNLSDTYNKETKMGIKSLKEYQSYRLNQLEQLKAQGMDDVTYFNEVEKVKNLVRSSPINIADKLQRLDGFEDIERKVSEIKIYKIDN